MAYDAEIIKTQWKEIIVSKKKMWLATTARVLVFFQLHTQKKRAVEVKSNRVIIEFCCCRFWDHQQTARFNKQRFHGQRGSHTSLSDSQQWHKKLWHVQRCGMFTTVRRDSVAWQRCSSSWCQKRGKKESLAHMSSRRIDKGSTLPSFNNWKPKSKKK